MTKGKIDPYKHKERYQKWIGKHLRRIEGISEINSKLILQYLSDMQHGLNIALGSKKGARSYSRLNTLRNRLIFLSKLISERYKKDLIDVTEAELHNLFTAMREGEIRRKDGEIYKSAADYTKCFKAFWHWYMKINKKNSKIIPDTTTDLDTSKDKPKFVYITEQEFKKLADKAKYEYRILMYFLYDTGIRSPTELINIRVSDFSNQFKELEIREEISKTFGRRIKLMLCSDLIEEYVKEKGLKDNDCLFDITPALVNRYLKRLANRVLKKDSLTMYDFRHNSACYWLPRYKSESALKYRFGWKKSDMIHYYTEFLGMKDTIREEDMLIDITKTEIEKQLQDTEKKITMLQEENTASKTENKEMKNALCVMYNIIVVMLRILDMNDILKGEFKKQLNEVFPEGETIYSVMKKLNLAVSTKIAQKS